MLVAAFVLATLMREVPLRTMSGIQAAKASDEQARAARAKQTPAPETVEDSPESPPTPFKATMPGASIAVDEYVEDQGEARTPH